MKWYKIMTLRTALIFLGAGGVASADQIRSVKEFAAKNQPLSYKFKLNDDSVKGIQLTELNIEKLKSQANSQKPGTGPFKFAEATSIDLDPSSEGKWTEVGGLSIWRLKVSSPNAVSLNVAFSELFLPQNAKIFMYTADLSKAAVFDDKYNKSHGQLWSPVFHTNELIVEVNVPTYLKKYLQFKIKQINQGFRSIEAAEMTKSGDCNINVVCPQGDEWRDEIRSVARVVIDGSGLCTGTLINNTMNNSKPYFISADHCGIDNSTAASLVFYWNYEASQCDMDTDVADGSLTQFQSGSTFKAAYDASDFALVELDEHPDNSFNVHWAGWDATDAVATSAVAIHHPSGDEKRISFENDALTITSYGSDSENPNGTHLRVGAWDEGTTEGGSSGSAIWNSDKRIVGTLTGGAAACSTPDAPDWYGRMAIHWLGNNTESTQLKAWLDPQNTGAMTLDGTDGCAAPTGTVTLSAATVQLGQGITASATASGGSGEGYTFSWDFNGDKVQDATGQEASYTYNHFHTGNVEVTISDSTGCSSSNSEAIVVTESDEEIFTTDGQLPLNWQESAISDANWRIASDESFEGTVSLQAGSINNNQNSSIETVYNFEQSSGNFISFAAKTSSEEGFDKLKFYIDDTEMMSLSGESYWRTYYFSVEPGTRELRWSYEKDSSEFDGSDTAWIDGVTGIVLESGGGNGDDGDTGDNGDTGGDNDNNNSGSSGSGGGALFWLILVLAAFRGRFRS